MNDHEVEVIRQALRSLPIARRPHLYAALDHLRTALFTDNESQASVVIECAPDGPIRLCLERIAEPYARRWREQRRNARPVPSLAVDPKVKAYTGPQRTLGAYKELKGVVVPPRAHCQHNELYWERVDDDAFAHVYSGSIGHTPVALDFRHNPKDLVGVSKSWRTLDGGLRGTFIVGSTPRAQRMAARARAGELGLSMSVRFATRWTHCIEPDEYDPDVGCLDLATHERAYVEAVGLTPNPTFSGSIVERVA